MENKSKNLILPLVLSTILISFIFGMLFALLSPNAKGAEGIGVIEDEFFKDQHTIVSIRELVPHDTIIMAIVDATTNEKTQTLSIQPFFTKTWLHDDHHKSSQCQINTSVICGHRKLDKVFLKEQEYPYVYMRELEENSGVLTLGGRVTTYLIKEYKREDGSIFREKGEALFDLEMREERVGASDVAVCFKEWVITSQWQRKTRHARHVYSAVDVYHTTIKITYGLTLKISKEPELLKKDFYRKELTYKHDDPETPECGNNGGDLPAGCIIIK